MNQDFKAKHMLTPEWERLITLAQRVQFGEMRIVIKNGKPCYAENLIKRVNLDSDGGLDEGLELIPIA